MGTTKSEAVCVFCFTTFEHDLDLGLLEGMEEEKEEGASELLQYFCLQKDFFLYFGAYMKEKGVDYVPLKDHIPIKQGEILEDVLFPCQKCVPILQEFCDAYVDEATRSDDLKMNWSLWRLRKVIVDVDSKRKVVIRRTEVKMKKWGLEEIAVKLVRKLRTIIAEKILKRLQETYPRLILKRCDVVNGSRLRRRRSSRRSFKISIAKTPSQTESGYGTPSPTTKKGDESAEVTAGNDEASENEGDGSGSAVEVINEESNGEDDEDEGNESGGEEEEEEEECDTKGAAPALESALAKIAPYKCEKKGCQFAFYITKGLKRHQELHGSFKCNFCKVTKTYAPNLTLHEISEHSPKVIRVQGGKKKGGGGGKKFLCPRCDHKTNVRASMIVHHLGVHLGLKPNKDGFRLSNSSRICAVCKKVVNSDVALLFHMRSHHDDGAATTTTSSKKKFKGYQRCDESNCKAYFLKRIQLRRHKLWAHSGEGGGEVKPKRKGRGSCRSKKVKEEKLFPCSKCDKRFQRRISVKRHMKTHHHESEGVKVEVPSSSSSNGIATKKGRKLKRGKEGGQFNCDTCKTSYKSKVTLEYHMLSHTTSPENWPFACDVCGKRTKTKQNMEVHKKIHFKKAKHRCRTCGQGFKYRKQLRDHHNSPGTCKGNSTINEG